MGIGDWGLGIGDWAQSPIPTIPNPQSPIPITLIILIFLIFNSLIPLFKNQNKTIYNNK